MTNIPPADLIEQAVEMRANSYARALRAIRKHGVADCMEAYDKHAMGCGARTIACEFKVSTNQADAMIDAGRIAFKHAAALK